MLNLFKASVVCLALIGLIPVFCYSFLVVLGFALSLVALVITTLLLLALAGLVVLSVGRFVVAIVE